MCSDQRREGETNTEHGLISLVLDENRGKQDGRSSAVSCSGPQRSVRKGKHVFSTSTRFTDPIRSIYQSVPSTGLHGS